MNFKLKSYHLYIGLVVFSLLTFLGIINDIGWSAILTRSSLWTILISGLAAVIDAIFQSIIWPPVVEEELQPEQETEGQLLDVVLPEEDSLIQEALLRNALQKDSAEQTSSEGSENSVFKPFTPQQIDPEVESMIRNDPAMAAEIIRKMGLE